MKSITGLLLPALLLALISGCASPELRTARIAVNERDWDRALKALDAELARMPNNAEALYLIGFCYENLSDWGKMAQSYDKSLAVSDLMADKIAEHRQLLVSRYFNRAAAAYDSAEKVMNIPDPEGAAPLWRESLAYLDTAIVIDPHDVRLYRQGTVTAYYAELMDRATEYALKAVELEGEGGKDLSVREVLLAIYVKRGDDEKTIVFAHDLMSAVNPVEEMETYLRAYDALMAAYMNLGENEKAQELTRKAVALFPERIDLKINLAVLMIKRKNYDAAEEIYRDILDKEPMNFDANLNVGTILVNEDRWEEAIPYLERAHQLEPGNLVAVQNLMAAYFNTGQDQKGLEMKRKLDELKGTE